jgi:hypothetical protein
MLDILSGASAPASFAPVAELLSLGDITGTRIQSHEDNTNNQGRADRGGLHRVVRLVGQRIYQLTEDSCRAYQHRTQLCHGGR